MAWDLLNLALRPLHVAFKRDVGLVLRGSVDEVRKAASSFKAKITQGVEIIGREMPDNPSCAFLARLSNVRWVRLFAARLTEMEALQSLELLSHIELVHVAKSQSIALDCRMKRRNIGRAETRNTICRVTISNRNCGDMLIPKMTCGSSWGGLELSVIRHL